MLWYCIYYWLKLQLKSLIFLYCVITPLAHAITIQQSIEQLKIRIDDLNATKPKCPVRFNVLVFGKEEESLGCAHSLTECICAAHIYLKCGHVQGNHRWTLVPVEVENYPCPVCRSKGPVVKLSVGMETGYYVDRGPLTHCFDPCGHIATEKTIK